MTDETKTDFRFDNPRDHLFDMIENHRRWEALDDRDDMNAVLAMVRNGDVEMDPSCSVIRMTAKAIAWAVYRSEAWEDHRFPTTPPERMSIAEYALRLGVAESTVRRACRGRLKFATHRGRIDFEIADVLWNGARHCFVARREAFEKRSAPGQLEYRHFQTPDDLGIRSQL